MTAILKKVLETRVLEDTSPEALNLKLRHLQENHLSANVALWEPHGDIVVFQAPSYTRYYILVVNRYSVSVYGD